MVSLFVAFLLFLSVEANADDLSQTSVNNSNATIGHTTTSHINVSLHKKQDKYVLQKELSVSEGKNGYKDEYQLYKGKKYNGSINSFMGKSLGYFPADEMAIMICMDGFGSESGCQELSEGDIELRLPYFPNGKYADIYNPKGEKVLTIDLTAVATCNENRVCDAPKENLASCPLDCVKAEEFSNLNVTGQENNSKLIDESTDQAAAVKKSGSLLLPIMLITLAILIIAGSVIFWLKRGKNNDYNEE